MEDKKHHVYEAASVYDLQSDRYAQLSLILGDPTLSIKNELDLITLSRDGLPRRTLDAIANKLNISLERLSGLLHISYRTILRKKKSDSLSVHVSEQVIAIAEVVRRGIEVLDSDQAFATWLHADLPGLDFQKPLNYLDTSFGTTMILKTLGRIEHGIY